MTHSIPYAQLNIFSGLVNDYLERNSFFKAFITDFPDKESLLTAANNRVLSVEKRQNLFDRISAQYREADLTSPETLESILSDNTVTITTGHQLNLFTGPLYSIFKISSVINLCRQLNEESEKIFVPVFWMATEDHDLDEINHTYCYGKKIEWQTKQTGAVGHMELEGIAACIDELANILGDSGKPFVDILRWAYSTRNLAQAHRRLVSKLFEGTELIIIDGDDSMLKASFSEIMRDEILNKSSQKAIQATNQLLEETYKIQAHARDINLFYLSKGKRSRIIVQQEGYGTSDGSFLWKESELLELLEQFPERFSPNVMLRPLYQECILPNVAYVGGGGELAYWTQLKQNFDQYEVPYPILILRNSMGFMSQKEIQKLEKLNLNLLDLFSHEHELTAKVVSNQAEEVDFFGELDSLKMIFKGIYEKATGVDQSLEGTVNAELRKLEKSVQQINGKVIKAQKRQHEASIGQALKLKSKLFPEGKLQERCLNVSQFYTEQLIPDLIGQANPLDLSFKLLER